MVFYERFYEEDSKYSKGNVKSKVLCIELIAIPGKVDPPDKRGYYFRGDFEIRSDNLHKVGRVYPQVHGKFAKRNYEESTGWYWYWHEGSLKSLSIFIQKLDGFKPISIEHRHLLKDYIEKLERLENRCTR